MGPELKLEKYEGPLDLLLHLIEKNKFDIFDIPIAEITDQYMEYIGKLQDIEEDMDVMSEFLVMASELLDIKCRMLLPREVNEEGEEEDPRDELVQQLLQYKMCRYATEELKSREKDAQRNLYHRRQLPKEVESYVPPVNYNTLLSGTNAAALTKIFEDVLKRQKYRVDPVRAGFGKIEKQEVNLASCELYVRAYLNEHEKTDFRHLLEKGNSKDEVIVTFLVLLELMKTGKIRVTQSELFGEIDIVTLGHIDTGNVDTTDDFLK